MAFGKFHGHTLGQIAAFEPSYIDWVAGTVTRDPDLVSAARVVQADLDRRGIARGAPTRRPTGRRRPHRLRPSAAPDPPGNARSPPDTGRRPMTRMNSDELLPPRRSPGLLAEDPVTRLVIWIRDLPPRTSSRADGRFQFRDRRPRYLPVRSRGGVGRMYASADASGNGTLVPIRHRRRSGASAHQARDARTRCQDAPPPAACGRDSGYPVAHARTPPPRPPRARARARARRLRRRRAAVVRSDRRLHDRRPRRRRLPGPRGARPDELRGRAPGDARFRAQLLRRRTSARSRRTGIKEVRFAGGTWTFGAERAAVLAVFTHARA